MTLYLARHLDIVYLTYVINVNFGRVLPVIGLNSHTFADEEKDATPKSIYSTCYAYQFTHCMLFTTYCMINIVMHLVLFSLIFFGG